MRETREEQNLFLRQVAAHLEVDTALLSKAERVERNLNREQIIKLSKFFNSSEEDFKSLWLCDKVFDVHGNDSLTIQGIKKALTKFKN